MPNLSGGRCSRSCGRGSELAFARRLNHSGQVQPGTRQHSPWHWRPQVENPLSPDHFTPSLRVLSYAQKRAGLAPLLNRMLIPKADTWNAFRSGDWRRVVVSSPILPSRWVFDALRAASGGKVAPPCVLCCRTSDSLCEDAAVSDWDYDDLETLQSGPLINVESALVDSMERWACLRSVEGYAVIGGSPDWFERFVLAAGGSSALLDDFRDGVASGAVGTEGDAVWRSHQAMLESLA